MITLQNLLESDSLSTIIAKLNNNFQVISLAGGGPQGIRGNQGLPGLPGRKGETGAQGPVGPTGLSAYMIPFADGVSGTTGPSSIAGPWPIASLDYLDITIGTGGQGDIYIDHYNRGYWMYLTSADSEGQYANIGPTYPPTGTGYYGGPGWYFYPQPETQDLSNVWTYDYSTYFTNPPYATGPFDTSSSPLKIPNARFNSKYGTIWVSAGNSGATGSQDYNTPSIESWGQDYGDAALPFPQPGRWNAGVDRLLFKFSLDSLPYHSIINARSTTLLDQPANAEDTSYPRVGIVPLSGDGYWVKPMYDTPLDDYTPLFFWSELRPDSGIGEERFSTLGLYQYTATLATPYGGGAGITAGSTAGSIFPKETKSMFLLSTRLAPSPEDYDAMSAGAGISNARTINLAELVLDVKSLTTSNQIICALPQDLVLSSDYVNSGDETYRESSSPYAYRVFQGFISAANGKNVGGQVSLANFIDYGAGIASSGLFNDTPLLGNQTRRSWYGSGFRFDDVSSWSTNSSDPLSEGYARLAGMAERGKRTWNTTNDDTYFLSELIFYTSQYKLDGSVAGADHAVSSQDIDASINEQRSLPSLYVSPFRNIGIGTFTSDDNGVWEPLAKMHIHINPSVLSNDGNDPTNVWMQFGNIANKLDINTQLSKVAAFTSSTSSANNQGFIDFYLGRTVESSYESANPYGSGTSPITSATGNFRIGFRREGWYANEGFDSFRLGVQPAATGTNIGEILDNYRNEFQVALHPLNANATEVSNTGTAITGFGVHNLWPRTRFHIYGKNKYNETDRGITDNDAVYAGYAYAAQGSLSSTYPYYQPNYRSNTQVITDFIGDSYLYPTGILEYPYTTLGGSPTAGVGTGSLGAYSTNAANFPFKEILSPTRHIIPYGNTGDSGSLYAAFYKDDMSGITASTGAFNNAFRHGGIENALFKPVHYQGFNLFRDLMNKGDVKDETITWISGTNGGTENGGSVILTNGDGDLAISSIKSGRNGGKSYRFWEQRLSTRDVLNNIKLIVKKDGSVGFGNAAGFDENAYASTERNITTGFLNYVPRPAVANGLTASPSTAGASPNHNIAYYSASGAYGLVLYTGVSGSFIENSSTSNAALINSNATISDTFRAEFAAEKLHGRPGRTLQNGGWGYPPSSTINITNADALKYIVLKSPYNQAPNTSYVNALNLQTDWEGRVTSCTIFFAGQTGGFGITGGTPPSTWLEAIMIPHPTEFESGAPLDSYVGSYEAPVGAVAAAWDGENVTWNGTIGSGMGFRLTFEQDPLILGNIRLNNFVAGEGLGLSGANENSGDAVAVKEARQQSPKLVFTFLEADATKIPGDTSTSRPITSSSAYRKVNTVVASAQNESSLREYWIPKTDNTGGTFMVFTDHYGQKEKNSGFDNVTVNMDNFLLEEVVTLEFIYGYTATAGVVGVAAVTGATSNYGTTTYGVVSGGTDVIGNNGGTGYWPSHVIYTNRRMLDDVWPTAGYTGPLASDYKELFTSDQYAKMYAIGPSMPNGRSYISWPDGNDTTGMTGGGTASTMIRNIDKFYNIFDGSTGNYDGGWGDPNYENKASEFRFKRINSEFALIDFNVTVAVRNPNLNTGIAPGEVGDSSVSGNQSELIDRGSPRWTQFIRLKYFPSATDLTDDHYQRNLFLYDLFGNGLGFANWSSYKNWNSGWAVVGDDTSAGTLSTSNTGDSFYMLNQSSGATASNYFNRWNGNVINYGMSYYFANDQSSILWQPRQSASTSLGIEGTAKTYTWIDTKKASNKFVYSQSVNMVNEIDGAADLRQAYFQTYLGATFQLMGNRAFSRNRSCAWRIVPQFGNYYADNGGIVPTESGSVNRNSFALEIMFDDPIMHHDIPLRDAMFNESSITGTGTGTYYKYLTVSGQSIIRYSNNYTRSWTTPPEFPAEDE